MSLPMQFLSDSVTETVWGGGSLGSFQVPSAGFMPSVPGNLSIGVSVNPVTVVQPVTQVSVAANTIVLAGILSDVQGSISNTLINFR
jgi:hypothetical protein